MSQENSVTVWIGGLKSGDIRTSIACVGSVLERLVRARRHRLPANCRRSFDEEDVAFEHLPELLRPRRPGPVPEAGRSGRPLAAAGDDHRAQGDSTRCGTRRVQKRGGGHVVGESALLVGEDGDGDGVAEVLSREPNPRASRPLRRRLCTGSSAGWRDQALRAVEMRGLDGSSQPPEIARELKVSTKTVERKAPADPRHLEPGQPLTSSG